MRRRTLLAAAGTGTAALAGCLADGVGFGGSGRNGSDTRGRPRLEGGVVGHFEDGPTRPECVVESERVEIERDGESQTYETATTIPYPGSLDSFSVDAVVDYVEAFEEAYVTHVVLCGRRGGSYVLQLGFHVRDRETFEWYEDISTVFLLRAGAATAGIDRDGDRWVAELAYEGVVYAVDWTGVARAEMEGAHPSEGSYEKLAPDPLEEGRLVAVFD